ncbi:hypothetical protein NS331_08405 [Pseudacidovorax intermedius]|uniref:Lipoprotein n=1 Tax=Pseudacidovorax intermedius TaxID=433924 RepID=A0A147GZY5_9BURK|nr:hypothetical protein NS331_08405 [Pseudacidovorax intermedius]
MRAALLGLSAALLTGCAAGPSARANVPVPVECGATEPARPAMPTEALSLGVDVDRWVAAAQAELLLREGYEGELRAALAECVEPVR